MTSLNHFGIQISLLLPNLILLFNDSFSSGLPNKMSQTNDFFSSTEYCQYVCSRDDIGESFVTNAILIEGMATSFLLLLLVIPIQIARSIGDIQILVIA
uniref:G_PROTEIN_RECEP_F1_2 domain-containing protein n=1 Tax=Caenorhabditis tropicalis TaxID=1561998 RepID=A0A1I7TSI3_9PELO